MNRKANSQRNSKYSIYSLGNKLDKNTDKPTKQKQNKTQKQLKQQQTNNKATHRIDCGGVGTHNLTIARTPSSVNKSTIISKKSTISNVYLLSMPSVGSCKHEG